jgi:hypothetical protein
MADNAKDNPMTTDHATILFARNRTRHQRQVYLHEAEANAAQVRSTVFRKVTGKTQSVSQFYWAAGALILGMLGCKFPIYDEKEKECIRLLRNEIDKRMAALK